MAIESEEEFIRVVQQAERDADENLSTYKTKLALLALLGYAVIFGLLILLLGLVGGIVALAIVSTSVLLLLIKKKIIFAILFAIWTIARALWVRFDPPQGYVLTKKEYPELFSVIDELTDQLDALKIHKVILDRNLNAAVVQHPRLGIFGWDENTLIVGLQLLLTLSEEEMRSVLAHEFGHLSGNHSRFSGWIYRVRMSWQRMMEAFEHQNSFGAGLMRKFFNWYAPQFSAYSFALARKNEYEADAIAAELTSPEIATKALVNVHATAPYIDTSYWQNYFLQADEKSEPNHAPFEGLKDFIRDNPLARTEMIERIKSEMQEKTHYADTHPSLKDRVDALGALPQRPESPTKNAAESWLGERYQVIMNDFDKEWLAENAEEWKNRYEYVTNAKDKLIVFAQQEADNDGVTGFTDGDLWHYAYWNNEFQTSEQSLPLFQEYQKRYPKDVDAAYYIGVIKLNAGDDVGLEQLKIARESANLIEQATKIGYAFLMEAKREEEAETWWDESITRNEQHVEAQHERDNLSEKDTYKSAELSEEQKVTFKKLISDHPKISKAWIVEKVLTHYPEHPVYVIVFKPKGINLASAETLQQQVADTLELGVEFFVICNAGDTKKLAKKLIKIGDVI